MVSDRTGKSRCKLDGCLQRTILSLSLLFASASFPNNLDLCDDLKPARLSECASC